MENEYYNAAKMIFESKALIREELDKLRAKRKNTEGKRLKPCIYMASVVKPPSSTANPNPRPQVKIVVCNVSNGHGKKSFVQNMARRGKFPVGYDFPTDELVKRHRDMAATATSALRPMEAAYVLEKDPYSALRLYLDTKISEIFGQWEKDDIIEDGQAKLQALEEKLAKAEAETARLRAAEQAKSAKPKEEPKQDTKES